MHIIVNGIKAAFLEGYATTTLTIPTMFLCLGFTALLGLYIFVIYHLINKKSFYNRNFNLSLVALAVITSAIILTIQSNVVVSLGMVGALSIVRFRTAIKDPMDLVFLFWAISVGIICGAGFAMIALLASIILTIIILLVSVMPSEKNTQVLVVNLTAYRENDLMKVVHESCRYSKVRARNINGNAVNMAIEVQTAHAEELISSVLKLENISSVSLVEHDGNITA